ncbi:MAG: guanylate kinase [Armatimonadota bacterium]
MTASPEQPTSQPRGRLFILSGPSGVGKDTVLQRALLRLRDIRTSVSVTTRAPRSGEQQSVNYFFVSDEEFQVMLQRGDLLEHARVHGKCYGTPRPWVAGELAAGTDVVLEIDVQGALQIKHLFPDAVYIFIAPPSWQELARRLRQRQTEDEGAIRTRLRNARQELEQVGAYDYLIINDRLSDAVDRLRSIVIAERCRPWQQDLRGLLEEENHG